MTKGALNVLASIIPVVFMLTVLSVLLKVDGTKSNYNIYNSESKGYDRRYQHKNGYDNLIEYNLHSNDYKKQETYRFCETSPRLKISGFSRYGIIKKKTFRQNRRHACIMH